jgi:hypothetical protein
MTSTDGGIGETKGGGVGTRAVSAQSGTELAVCMPEYHRNTREYGEWPDMHLVRQRNGQLTLI